MLTRRKRRVVARKSAPDDAETKVPPSPALRERLAGRMAADRGDRPVAEPAKGPVTGIARPQTDE